MKIILFVSKKLFADIISIFTFFHWTVIVGLNLTFITRKFFLNHFNSVLSALSFEGTNEYVLALSIHNLSILRPDGVSFLKIPMTFLFTLEKNS